MQDHNTENIFVNWTMTIVTFFFGFISVQTMDIFFKTVTFIIATILGISTIYLNYIRIKNEMHIKRQIKQSDYNK